MSIKPFYSVRELCKALGNPPEKMRDALQAAGVAAFHGGKPADLSGWWSGIVRTAVPGSRGHVEMIAQSHIYEPDPSEVIVSTDSLPESWKECLAKADASTSAPKTGETSTTRLESAAGVKGEALSPRERTTMLNIIGALLEARAEKEAAIIDDLLRRYPKKAGIAKSTLEQKFAEAKRSLAGE